MARKVRTWIVLAIAAVVGVPALAGVAAPYVVDVDAYRPAIVQAVKEATGRELVIEGPLKLSMFPQPRVSARKVRFANALGTKGAQMVDVEWIGASPAWWPLLRGQFEIGRLTLYKPAIILEADAKGRPNWEFEPGAGAVQSEGAPSAGFHLAVGRLRIVQGTLTYAAPTTGTTLTAQEVDITASAGSLEGPFTLIGTATVNGVPLSLDAIVGGPTDKGHLAALKLKVESGTLDFDGRISRIAADAEVNGKLSVATGGLTDFVTSVSRAIGQAPPAIAASLVGQFAFDGGIELKADRLALADFKMSMGGDTASGSLSLTGGAAPSIEGRLSMPKVDVDRWLEVMSKPAASPPQVQPPTSPPAPPSPPATSLSPFPPQVTVSVALEAKEVIYRKAAVRDLDMAIAISKGVIEIPRLSVVLPGEAVLQANAAATPAKPGTPAAKPAAGAVQSAGTIRLASAKPRDTLAWLGIDMSGVPAGKLQTLGFSGKIASTSNAVKVDELVLDLDGQRATGSGSITFGLPLNVVSTVQLDRFDLDAYIPKAAATTLSPVAVPVVPATVAPAVPAVPDKTAPVLGMKAKVAKLVYRGETLNGVDADVSLQGNLLKLNGLKVADLLGAKLDLKGQVADFGTEPRFDLTFTISMPDTDKLLVYAGLPKFINGKIGAATASGGVVGTMGAMAVRNATVTMAGTTARATGSLVLGDNFAFDFPSFGLQARDASQLVSVATGRAQSGIGGLEAAGAFKGNEKNISFEGNLTAMRTPMIGRIEAGLAGRPNIMANLRIPGTLDFDSWLGVADGGAPPPPAAPANSGGEAAPAPVRAAPARVATGKAIDLSALRAFDATLNLETSALELSSLKVLYGDMTASLRNGVFKISKLTGQFYGGAVDFVGTVDASKASMSIDLTGSLQGIYLGELLRGAASTSTFGNDHLMVAVDGKINVMQIEVHSQGVSPEQIRDSLTGRGKVSGYLYPSVAAGSLGLASFATGIGSIFSTEMGFGSAVLSGFINVQSSVAGDLDISNGVLSLQNHTVQGQNAVAMINSRTSLTAATTETTISLDTGSRGSIDYVMTVKGPVSSPTMNVGGR
ncbi:MAG: AsmA family protein [Alphaproteobacteria bacterium]|nr:AsmA family protein [Alphaproteobacteria bacterium]